MKIIIGLGNPGAEYSNTRHNIGFNIIDNFAKKKQLEFVFKPWFNSEIAEYIHNQEKIILCKPSTFMNNSGEAVLKLKQFFKIENQDILVIYDDIDLKLGKIKIYQKGGAGTHNGMKSIISKIGSEFPRLRCGIESRGVSSPEQQATSSFVLSNFTPDETEIALNLINKATKALESILKNGYEKTMNGYN
ncbi:aminoacyl-tRNA hydrolase [Candidatus Peregrinibacteria bacterium]|nr:aminoacyl-tRNA hydrolase [Candidatus Peregrinibacteria bacterium]